VGAEEGVEECLEVEERRSEGFRSIDGKTLLRFLSLSLALSYRRVFQIFESSHVVLGFLVVVKTREKAKEDGKRAVEERLNRERG